MTKMLSRLETNPLQKKLFKAFGVIILASTIPLTLITPSQRLGIRKEAIEANTAHFSLVPNSVTLAVDETVTARVWLNSGDNGAVILTSVINFDKGHLGVESITTTNVFSIDISVTPVQEANATGRITITEGLSPQQTNPVVGAHEIAQIEFRATAVTGVLSTDNVSFDTNASKVANAQGSWMTLTAQGAKYQVTGVTGNLLSNGSFEEDGRIPAPWRGKNLGLDDGRVCDVAQDGSCSFKMVGTNARKLLGQRVNTSGSAGDSFTLSGWSRAENPSPTGAYCLGAMIFHTVGTKGKYITCFTSSTHDWEYIETTFTVAKDYNKIVVYLRYKKQSGQAWFDDVRLIAH